MIETFTVAKELAEQLGFRRLSKTENELCRLFRTLGEDQQFELILQILATNARAAASVAQRGGVSVVQQGKLLKMLVSTNQTNALKSMVRKLFAHRMKAALFLKVMCECREQFPNQVHLAIYYFMSARPLNPRTRARLRILLEITKPAT